MNQIRFLSSSLTLVLTGLSILSVSAQQTHQQSVLEEARDEQKQVVKASEARHFLSDVSQWDWSELDGEFKVSVRSDRSWHGMQEPVYLLVAVRNVSDHPRMIVEMIPEYMFPVTLLDEDGNPVQLTQYGESLKVKRIFFRHGTLLGPGDALGYVLDLRRMFDLTMPGTYSVQVGASSFGKEGLPGEDVSSNTIELELRSRDLPGINEFLEQDMVKPEDPIKSRSEFEHF